MALRNNATLIFFVILVLCGASSGVVYRVGDSNGWNSRGLVDYKKWASSKDFHVGDVLIFFYTSQFHNVKQVSVQDFESCNATSALSTYSSGRDTITLKSPEHHYFLCGVPGHCEAGQKVEIKVTLPVPDNLPASPSSSPDGSSSPSASHSKEIPSNSNQSRASILGMVVTALVLSLFRFVF